MSRKKLAQRRKRSAAGRLARFWIAFAAIFALAIACAYVAATWSGFDPRNVSVSGNAVVSKRAILQAAAIAPDRNVWLQNVRAAVRRVERIPYVERVWIHRRLPAGVRIVVSERVPMAVVRSGNASGLVDGELRVLALDPASSSLPLLQPAHPVALAAGAFLTDAQVVALRGDLAALEGARVPVARVSLDSYGSVSAQLKNGVTVLFGDADFAKKVALVRPILSQLSAGRPFRAIDLRALDAPVVVYK